MTDRAGSPPSHAFEPYSPRRRTALVLTGTGTAGAYHAGVLRALHEAGVKIDVVAGRGIGAIGALFVAVDGAPRLWEDQGFWRGGAVKSLYAWRAAPRIIGLAVGVAFALVAVPVAAVALGLVVFPIHFVLEMIGVGAASGLVGAYLHAAQAAFAADALPTWLPRLVVLVLTAAAAFVIAEGWRHDARTPRGPWWWRGIRAPLSSSQAVTHTWRNVWDLLRGAAQLKQPPSEDLARRYIEVLSDNLGQPGFCELVITVHDLDSRRDLIVALLGDSRRRELIRRPTTAADENRRAEVLDLAGTGRDHLVDAVAASLAVPLITEPRPITFAADAYWRGETHRLCDRPASLIRLIDELIDLGAQQIILAAATPEPTGPHTLAPPRVDGRGRLGEYLESSEAAVLHDATTTTAGVRIYTVRPVHNPIGPFDFGGGFDDRSHRRQSLAELMARGYEDAYQQFIDPVVGASGERIPTAVRTERS
jgi:predicted acylesterase/phospholipase RssA